MAPLLILFLVGAGQENAFSTRAMRQAVEDVLVPRGTVEVDAAPPDLTDAAAVEQGEALGAIAVVRVMWVAGARSKVEVRIHREGSAGTTGWISRVLEFDPTDARDEIGRAIGYTVLAMLPALSPGGAGAAAPGARPRPPAPAPPAAATPTAAISAPPARPAAAAGYFLVDVGGVASAGLGGVGGGWGGGLRGGWAATPHLRLAVGALARIGEVAPAEATTTTAALTAGAAVTARVTQRVGVALRADALAELLTASHFAGPGSPSRVSRWLPGAGAALEGEVWLSASVALFASAGVEVVAGRTDIFVGTEKVATIPQARAVGELGLRMRF